MPKPEIYLAGAGCLDAKWLPEKTRNMIEKADVIVCDDLADPSILALNDKARVIFMGKRGWKKSALQEEINEQLIDLTKDESLNCIVRLKGGDPFVFGRGLEEADALRAAGFDCQVLPGLTSALTIPEKAGLSLTDRRWSGSFTVIPGMQANESLKEDPNVLASLKGTLVILMGITKLESITRDLLEAGKDPNTPAAILCSRPDGTLHKIFAPLCDLAKAARDQEAFSPAVIVIGEAASKEHVLWPEKQPAKICLGLASSAEFEAHLQKHLDDKYKLVRLAAMKRIPLNIQMPDLTSVSWIVLTSPFGVQCFFDLCRKEKLDIRKLAPVSFACIGSETANALEKHGIYPACVPQRAGSESLAAMLKEKIEPEDRLLWMTSTDPNRAFEKMMKDSCHLEWVPLYETKYTPAVKSIPVQGLVFSCAGCIESLLPALKENPSLPCFCLSKRIEEEIKKLEPEANCFISSKPSARSLAEVIEHYSF